MQSEEGIENQQNGEHFNTLAAVVVPEERKVRRDTTLASFMAKREEEKKVDWDGNPKGANQVRYSDAIGVLLKQYRRFNWTKHWDKHDTMAKDWLLGELQDLFIVDERYKTATLSIDVDIFRGKKGTRKGKHFTRHDTTAKRLADKPAALTEGEWKDLATFWETDATHQDEDNGGNPPTNGNVFIKTHVNKKTGKALDPISQGFIVQMREQSGLDENGFDEDGNQQPISDEVYGNVVPTTRQKHVRAETYPTCLSYERNEDFERRMKERDEDFDRRIRERDAEWEARIKARDEESKIREKKMLEYVRLCCRPEHVLSPGQFSGPSDYHFRPAQPLFAPWEHPYRPLEQLNRSGEQPYRHEGHLFRHAN
ncbi:uncharacterized protein LOC113342735 isoform X3 [Papaver somniferum]|uniref:uncharacterized protein LOC113342735 isoform X3 n=1 Tax=Papaver somniferum TaxID=3469 RepID=UPI000E701904|nr:uncharacterized protein LOC113342735 isoform X3 [Papaver somniferum]